MQNFYRYETAIHSGDSDSSYALNNLLTLGTHLGIRKVDWIDFETRNVYDL